MPTPTITSSENRWCGKLDLHSLCLLMMTKRMTAIRALSTTETVSSEVLWACATVGIWVMFCVVFGVVLVVGGFVDEVFVGGFVVVVVVVVVAVVSFRVVVVGLAVVVVVVVVVEVVVVVDFVVDVGGFFVVVVLVVVVVVVVVGGSGGLGVSEKKRKN